MDRVRATIRKYRWRLLIAAPILLVIAISINWVPFYLAFIADVCLVASAFGRRRRLQR